VNWPFLVWRSTIVALSIKFENSSASRSSLLVPPFFSAREVIMLKSPAMIQWRLVAWPFISSRSQIIPFFSSRPWGPYTFVQRISSVFPMICMRTVRVYLVASVAIKFRICGFHNVSMPPDLWWSSMATILYLRQCCLLIDSILSIVHFVS
jgi:hypothetical protein